MDGIESSQKGNQEDLRVNVTNEAAPAVQNREATLKLKRRKWWKKVVICMIFLFIGQTSAKLLQNFFYLHNGRLDGDENKQYKGTWMQALLHNAGFPLLILPLLFFRSKKTTLGDSNISNSNKTSLFTLSLLYIFLGVLQAAQTKLYSLGQLYISYSIFILICATQLIFTSIFTFIINRNKFNRWMVISIILVTFAGAGAASSSFGGEPDEIELQYETASWFTFFGNVAFGLLLSLMQLSFEKGTPERNHNKKSFSISMVLEMQIVVSLAASCICLVGLFTSNEYKELEGEMMAFNEGKAAYILTFSGLAISWQVCYVGLFGLVYLVSCMFSNVVYIVAWPVISILVVLIFRFMDDEVDWMKGGGLGLAVLGLSSYLYGLHKSKENRWSRTRAGFRECWWLAKIPIAFCCHRR